MYADVMLFSFSPLCPLLHSQRNLERMAEASKYPMSFLSRSQSVMSGSRSSQAPSGGIQMDRILSSGHSFRSIGSGAGGLHRGTSAHSEVSPSYRDRGG